MSDPASLAREAAAAAAAAHSEIMSGEPSARPSEDRPTTTQSPGLMVQSSPSLPVSASRSINPSQSVEMNNEIPETSNDIPRVISKTEPRKEGHSETPRQPVHPQAGSSQPVEERPSHPVHSSPSSSLSLGPRGQKRVFSRVQTQTPPSTSAIPQANRPAAIPNTPFISYAYQSGLADHLPSSLPANVHAVPTFYSEWAHVAPEEARPVREEMLSVGASKDHTRLMESKLSGAHEWCPVPVSNMSYKYYVENDREDVRPDLLRFKVMRIQFQETASEAWSKFVESRLWWIVPSTLRCDRTFCRDALDCYYVDAMDRMFAKEGEPVALECPLFLNDVLDRWWNAFSRKPDFLFELFTRLTAGVLVPYDSYETCHYTTEELKMAFPAAPGWMTELAIPAGIPLPLPPIAYYFPSDLCDGANETRRRRAMFFLKLEYMGLAIAFWYNEMEYGGRQWVVAPSTLRKLRENCLDLDIVKGVPTSSILNMMEGRRVRDPTYWNTYKSGADAIPDCKFVDCEAGTGDYLPWMKGGRVELANMKSRKVKLVLRQHRRVQARRSSPLGMKLLVGDLLRIPGLDNYARDQGLLQVDHVRVYDLISRLFTKVGRQSDQLRQLREELKHTRFERDGVRIALQDSERDLEQTRRREQVQDRNRTDEAAASSVPTNAPNRTGANFTHGYNRPQERHAFRPPQSPFLAPKSPFISPSRMREDRNDLPRIPRRPPTQHAHDEDAYRREPYPHYTRAGNDRGALEDGRYHPYRN